MIGDSLNDGIGSMPLFRVDVATDPKDSNTRIIDVSYDRFT